MSSGYGRNMKQPRRYTCYKCNISFVTSKPAPKCRNCGQTLKGTRKGVNRY